MSDYLNTLYNDDEMGEWVTETRERFDRVKVDLAEQATNGEQPMWLRQRVDSYEFWYEVSGLLRGVGYDDDGNEVEVTLERMALLRAHAMTQLQSTYHDDVQTYQAAASVVDALGVLNRKHDLEGIAQRIYEESTAADVARRNAEQGMHLREFGSSTHPDTGKRFTPASAYPAIKRAFGCKTLDDLKYNHNLRFTKPRNGYLRIESTASAEKRRRNYDYETHKYTLVDVPDFDVNAALVLNTITERYEQVTTALDEAGFVYLKADPRDQDGVDGVWTTESNLDLKDKDGSAASSYGFVVTVTGWYVDVDAKEDTDAEA